MLFIVSCGHDLVLGIKHCRGVASSPAASGLYLGAIYVFGVNLNHNQTGGGGKCLKISLNPHLTGDRRSRW